MGLIFDVRGRSLKMRTQQDWEKSLFAYGPAGDAIWGKALREPVEGFRSFSGFSKIGYRYFAHRSADWMQPLFPGAVSW